MGSMSLRGAALLVAALGCSCVNAAPPPTTYLSTLHESLVLGLPTTDHDHFYDVLLRFTGVDSNHVGMLSLIEVSNFTLGTIVKPVGGSYQMWPKFLAPYATVNCVPEPNPDVCRLPADS